MLSKIGFAECKPYYSRVFRLSVPLVLAQIGTTLVQLVDVAMVGHLNTDALSAVSFATSVFFIGFYFAYALLMGVTPLLGIAGAQHKEQKRVSLFQNTILLSVLGSVSIVLILYGLSFLLPYMGQEPAVARLAGPYYLILVWSIPSFMLFGAFAHVLEGYQSTLPAMIITLISNGLNIVLNYMLIYGKWGAPMLGVEGAGWATFITRLSMPLMFLGYLTLKPMYRKILLAFRWSLFSFVQLKEILKVGFPIAVHTVMEVSAFAVSGIIVGWVSKEDLAAHEIASNVSSISYSATLGISTAITILVSHYYGEENFKKLRLARAAAYQICFLVNLVFLIVYMIWSKQIASIYTSDPRVIYLGGLAIMMAAIFQISDGIQSVGAGVLRGLTDVKFIMYSAFVAYIVVAIPLGSFFCFYFKLGVVGIWIGLTLGLSLAAVLFTSRFRQQKKLIFDDDIE